MNEKTVILTAVMSVLLVGMVGMFGFGETGDVVKRTSSIQSRSCMCKIDLFGSDGNLMNTNTQKIRAKSSMKSQDCQTLCEQKFGKVSKHQNRVVIGYPVI